MNDFIKNLKERRSIRNFKDEMPPEKDIDDILEAGLYAASGMNRNKLTKVSVIPSVKRRPGITSELFNIAIPHF